ncbi:MAG: hypothetical protein QM682_11380, partial [Paracoccus sp. (in: a-proteobacteria)]
RTHAMELQTLNGLNSALTSVASLLEAAGIILRQNTKSSPLKVCGMALAKRRGPAKALVGAARRLAVILHRMWIDGTEYRWQPRTARAGLLHSRQGTDKGPAQGRVGRYNPERGLNAAHAAVRKKIGMPLLATLS